jgi:hypothetical protein
MKSDLRPMFHASDDEVREFVAEHFLHIGPMTNPDLVLTAEQIIAEAHRRFGRRAADLEFWKQ